MPFCNQFTLDGSVSWLPGASLRFNHYFAFGVLIVVSLPGVEIPGYDSASKRTCRELSSVNRERIRREWSSVNGPTS